MYSSTELRKQMIICKAKKRSAATCTKSILSFIAVWSLWGLSVFLIAKDYQHLFTHPIIHHWTLWEILKAILAFALSLLLVLQCWCLYVQHAIRYRRKYRPKYSN